MATVITSRCADRATVLCAGVSSTDCERLDVHIGTVATAAFAGIFVCVGQARLGCNRTSVTVLRIACGHR